MKTFFIIASVISFLGLICEDNPIVERFMGSTLIISMLSVLLLTIMP